MSDQWNGMPQNPERDGWHWLRWTDGTECPCYWHHCFSSWMWSAPWFVNNVTAHEASEAFSYVAPCLTPAEVAAAVQAEREACAKAVKATAIIVSVIGPPLDVRHDAEATLRDAEAAIRARGDTSALDAAIKAAVQAERAACLAAVIGEELVCMECEADEAYNDAIADAERAIRARGDTSTLDAAIQAAEARGRAEWNAAIPADVCEALIRTNECFEDGEDTDIGRPMIDRLVSIGWLEKAGRARWRVSALGFAAIRVSITAAQEEPRDD